MKIEHRFDVTTDCPNGGVTNYQVTMTIITETGKVVEVESIDMALNEILTEPLYQESLTERLAVLFKATVVTEGVHGRFRTRCEVTAC